MTKDSDIFLRIASRGTVEQITTRYALAFGMKHPEADIDVVTSPYSVTDMRNKMVKQFLASDRLWLVMLDDDVWPVKGSPVDLCIPGKDIVGATVFVFDGHRMLTTAKTKDLRSILRTYQYQKDDTGLQEVDGIGSAAMAIHRRVLTNPQMTAPFYFGQDGFGTICMASDLSFCERAAQEGIQTWWDKDVIFNHWTPCLTWEMQQAFGWLRALDIPEELRPEAHEVLRRWLETTEVTK